MRYFKYIYSILYNWKDKFKKLKIIIYIPSNYSKYIEFFTPLIVLNWRAPEEYRNVNEKSYVPTNLIILAENRNGWIHNDRKKQSTQQEDPQWGKLQQTARGGLIWKGQPASRHLSINGGTVTHSTCFIDHFWKIPFPLRH